MPYDSRRASDSSRQRPNRFVAVAHVVGQHASADDLHPEPPPDDIHCETSNVDVRLALRKTQDTVDTFVCAIKIAAPV